MHKQTMFVVEPQTGTRRESWIPKSVRHSHLLRKGCVLEIWADDMLDYSQLIASPPELWRELHWRLCP